MKTDSLDNKLLLISIKPQYAKKIFKGEKTIELRKSAPTKVKKGSYLLIYVTSPIKELWGICKIENIIKEKPHILWENVGKQTGITKQEFQEYYKTNDKAYGIQLKDIINFFENSINLDKLKSMMPGFMPPQTYGYIDKEFITESKLNEILILQ